MAKLTLADVSNILGNPSSAQTTINTNNGLVEAALENTLSRDGSTPNQMLADIDLNNNDLLNVQTVETESLVLNGTVVTPDQLATLPATVMLKTTYDPQNVEADAFDRANHTGTQAAETISSSIWTSGVTKTMKDRESRIVHILDFDADPTGGNDSTAALQACLAQAQTARLPMVVGSDLRGVGDFIIEQELEITQAGQIMRFDMTGGFGTEDDFGATWSTNGRLIVTGNWWSTTGKRVRSRRLFRGSAADPQDAPLSAVINIQARGVKLYNPVLWLDKDYASTSPTDYGTNVDVGIFSGCRAGVGIYSPMIIGHFRRAGVYWDVTHRFGLQRHLSVAGTPYPDAGEFSGADGCFIYEPIIRGSWNAQALLGARPKVGATAYGDPYYDQQLGGTISDGRGAVGFSDFHCIGGQMWSVDHGTNWRAADPNLDGGLLTETSLLSEPDSKPSVIHIDGLAANTSGAIWNISFHRCRFATFEAFRTRLDFASRVTFDNCHWDGRNSGTRKDTAGVVIDSNDYTTTSYGDVSSTANTSRVKVLGTPRAHLADGIGPHYYGPIDTFHYETSNGMIVAGQYRGAEEADIQGNTGFGVRFRTENTTIGTINTSGVANFTGGVALPSFTAAQIIDAGHAVNTTGKTTGRTVRDSTNSRLMVSNGSAATSTWTVADGSVTVTPV